MISTFRTDIRLDGSAIDVYIAATGHDEKQSDNICDESLKPYAKHITPLPGRETLNQLFQDED